MLSFTAIGRPNNKLSPTSFSSSSCALFIASSLFNVMAAELTVNVPAAPGRAVCQTVQLLRGEDGRTKAVPVFGRSGLISILTKADGYIVIPENQEGLKKGEMVEVFLI